ncbi:hypothetical protein [Psychrobacter sp. JB385]|uniref:hypothetical protein n=1 Tax=Psychrobacter sp. JB385 TaxID=1434841 RepID=UPI0015C62CFE|nr:hypothetical protein [Psychrobacter sp. JB385]
MKRLALAVITCSSILALSSCMVYDGRSEQYRQKLISKSLVSAQERDNILAKAQALPEVDSDQPRWLLVREYDNILTSGNETTKSYLDVNSILQFKNVAFGKVKKISPNKNYTVTNYRVFCQDGYIRKYEVDNYDENGAKKSEFISSLSENGYDEPIAPKDENMAKSICALAGFYKGMDPNLQSISAPSK